MNALPVDPGPESGAVAALPVKLTVLIPPPSPGLNLGLLLRILPAVVEVPHEVILVLGPRGAQSHIGSGHPRLTVLHAAEGQGVLDAIVAGVTVARGQYVLVFAADEVGPVMAIDRMLEQMDAGCDLVSSTRYAGGGRRLGGSPVQHALSFATNWLVHHVAGTALTDSTTGIKMFRRSVFEKLHLESRPGGWAVAFEMAIKAELLGLKIGEVPIVSIDRLYGGRSTFEGWRSAREYLRWLAWGMPKLRATRATASGDRGAHGGGT